LKVGCDRARPITDLAAKADYLDVCGLKRLSGLPPLVVGLVADITAVDQTEFDGGPSDFLEGGNLVSEIFFGFVGKSRKFEWHDLFWLFG
jgi:hypothetical protein